MSTVPVIADNRGVLRRDARETGGAIAPMPPRIGGNTPVRSTASCRQQTTLLAC